MLDVELMLFDVPAPLGENWSVISIGSSKPLFNIASNGAQICAVAQRAVGSGGFTVQRSTDGGLSFAEVLIDALGGSSANSYGIATKSGNFAAIADNLWATSADGASWAKTSDPFPGSPKPIDLVNVAGTYYTPVSGSGNGIDQESGGTWTNYPMATHNASCVAGDGSADGSNLLVGLNNIDGIYGATLTSGAPGSFTQRISQTSLGFAPECMAFAEGAFLVAGGTSLKRSIDGGTTWTSVLTASQHINRIVDLPEAGGIFVLCDRGVMYRSTDFGLSFRQLNTGLPTVNTSHLYGACYCAGAVIACGAAGTVIRSDY